VKLNRRKGLNAVIAVDGIQGGEELDILRIVFRCILVFGEVGNNSGRSVGTRKIRNKAESGNTELGLGTVEFRDDVGGTGGFADYDDWTGVAGLGLPVQGFLDPGIAD